MRKGESYSTAILMSILALLAGVAIKAAMSSGRTTPPAAKAK